MYKFDAFLLGSRWLAWEDNLAELAAFHSISGDVRMMATCNLDEKRTGTTEVLIGNCIFRRWHSWGVRDSERCIQLRLTYLREHTVTNTATAQAVLL